MKRKMKIEIWSDVMCPFCYLGKHKFEKALELFPKRDQLEIVWRSYQLQPQYQYEPGKNAITSDSEIKGIPREQLVHKAMFIERAATALGLTIDFDTVKKANTYDASRLIHLAGKHGLADRAEERLYRAYFSEGKVVSDYSTLQELGAEIGLDREEVSQMLHSDACKAEVNLDLEEARQHGIAIIPYFRFNSSTVASGSQSVESYFVDLEKAFAEWESAESQQELM